MLMVSDGDDVVDVMAMVRWRACKMSELTCDVMAMQYLIVVQIGQPSTSYVTLAGTTQLLCTHTISMKAGF